MNPDTFKLTGATLQSVNKEPDAEEEMMFNELFRELLETTHEIHEAGEEGDEVEAFQSVAAVARAYWCDALRQHHPLP